MVRTPGFQPDNRGSIPLGATKKELPILEALFYINHYNNSNIFNSKLPLSVSQTAKQAF